MAKPEIFMSAKEKEIRRIQKEMENKRLQQEQINKMKGFSKNLENTCKEMENSANSIFQEAKAAKREGDEITSKRLIRNAARMKSFGKNLSGFKRRVDCCIIEMKAFSNLAAIPELVKGINGFLSKCPNFAEIKYDMNNFGNMMKGMESALYQLEDAFNFESDDQFDEANVGNSSYDSMVSNYESQMFAELADEIPIGTPIGNSAGADVAVDADADAFARMMMDESSDK